MRIYRKPAHDLQSSRRILFPDRHIARQGRLDKTLAEHVAHVEQVIALWSWSGERPCGLVVGACRRHGNKLLLRIAQCGELATKSTSGIDIHGVVEPSRFRHRDMAINHQRSTSIVLGPIQADRKAELVGLAGGLSVERKVTDPT